MTGYFTRLARQSGLVPSRAATLPGTSNVMPDAAATDVVELHEERASPLAGAPAQLAPLDQAAPHTAPRERSHQARAAPREEMPHAATPAEARAEAPAAFAPAAAPGPRQPASAEPRSSTLSDAAPSPQALHLEAVQQVVEWIAAAPQPAPSARHDVRDTASATVVAQEPASPAAAPVVAAPARSAAPPAATVVRESPIRSSTPPSERRIVSERAVFDAPAGRVAEPARAIQPVAHVEEPQGESLSISIGSIQVSVEAPPQPVARMPAPAPQVAVPAPTSSRLARHYLRPY